MNSGSYHSQQPSYRNQGPVRFLAHLFSILFHPLFIASYVSAFLIFYHPMTYSGLDQRTKMYRMFAILLDTTLFPAFAILVSWRLKLVRSIYMHSAKERLIPYILVMFFYWWTWHVFNNLADSPPVMVRFLLGSFLAICAAWMCNIFFKISIHGVAMGGLFMFFLLFSFHDAYASGVYLSISALVAGIVCTARFIVTDHSSFDVYSGILTGMLTQLIAWQF